MKVIIPLAGKGTRLRPHTHSKPKPLLRVAGKPVLGHILEKLKSLPIDEIIFITGEMEGQVKDYVASNFSYQTRFIPQDQLKGDGHAVSLAEPYVTGEVMIIFVDTIFDTDLSVVKTTSADGIIWAKETATPERFGVVVVENERITKFVEKPKEFVSNLAAIGLYYFKDAKILFEHLHGILQEGRVSEGGEHRVADAISRMLEHGSNLVAKEVDVWADCGKPNTLLKTNRYLLENGHHREIPVTNSVIIPPVHIKDGAKIVNSIIGPNVSIGENCHIKNSIISDAIVDDNANLTYAALTKSLIGDSAIVRDIFRKLNVGDNSEIDFG